MHNKEMLARTGEELRARVKEAENSADEGGQRATGCWALRKRWRDEELDAGCVNPRSELREHILG